MPHALVIVGVPEVEPYVASLRERFDRSARRGLGAHVTLLHAPLPPGGVDAATLAAISGIASASAPFHYAATGISHFPRTLFLAVQPREPFHELHARLASLPVAGSQPPREFIPHISAVREARGGSGRAAGGAAIDALAVDALAVADAELVPFRDAAPIRCECHEIVLLEDSTGLWRPVRSFALSGCTDSPSPVPS